LRLRGTEDGVQIGMQFSASADPAAAPTTHAWWSIEGFEYPASWHHVAISYIFGQPDSIRALIDGRMVSGDWEADGPTAASPTAAAGALIIGAGYDVERRVSFNGWLDEVKVHRAAVP